METVRTFRKKTPLVYAAVVTETAHLDLNGSRLVVNAGDVVLFDGPEGQPIDVVDDPKTFLTEYEQQIAVRFAPQAAAPVKAPATPKPKPLAKKQPKPVKPPPKAKAKGKARRKN